MEVILVIKDWLYYALKTSRQRKAIAIFTHEMLDQQVRKCMDGMSYNSIQKIKEDRLRGIIK
jgi:hypothetical protein